MKVSLMNRGCDVCIDCFVNVSFEACIEYALMLHRSVFEPHVVRVSEGDRVLVTFEADKPVTPKRS